jgi:hypothetical protein
MKQSIIEENEQSLDELVVRARDDSQLKRIIKGEIRQHELALKKLHNFVFHTNSGVAFGPDYVVAGMGLHDLLLFKFIFPFQEHYKQNQTVYQKIRLNEDPKDMAMHQNILCYTVGSKLTLLDLRDPTVKSTHDLKDEIQGINFAGNHLAVTMTDKVEVYDIDLNLNLRNFKISEFKAVTAASMLDERIFYFGTENGKITKINYSVFRETEKRRRALSYQLPKLASQGHKNKIKKLACFYDFVAVTSADNSLRILKDYGDELDLVFETKDPLSFGVDVSYDAKYLITPSYLYEIQYGKNNI